MKGGDGLKRKVRKVRKEYDISMIRGVGGGGGGGGGAEWNKEK